MTAHISKIVILSASLLTPFAASASTIPPVDEIQKYLVIGTNNDENGRAISWSNGESGANSQQLSTFDPNTRDVFEPGKRWINDFQSTADALPVRETIEYRGDWALTAGGNNGGTFDASNVDFYLQNGIDCANGSFCNQGQSNSPYDVLDGPSGNNLSDVVFDFDPTALKNELDTWESFIFGLDADQTLGEAGFSFGQSGSVYTDTTGQDLNNDGFIVYDLVAPDKTFNLNNADWIIDNEDGDLAIFRIQGDLVLDLSDSSILVGNGYKDVFNFGLPETAFFGALFASSYRNTPSTNEGFNFNNVVLNGTAFWDLSAFNTGTHREELDTVLSIQNGQGCAQFIAPTIEMSDARFNGCTTPVPVPTSVALMLGGMGGLFILSRTNGALRRRKTV